MVSPLPKWKDNEELKGDEHELVKELYDIWDKLDQQRIFESWHDALQIREEVLDMYSLGILDLRNRIRQRLEQGEVAEIFVRQHFRDLAKLLHNLFGDTNAVHISCYKDHYEIDQIIDGETVAEVLDYVQYRYAHNNDRYAKQRRNVHARRYAPGVPTGPL